jgi:hypothetical protein
LKAAILYKNEKHLKIEDVLGFAKDSGFAKTVVANDCLKDLHHRKGNPIQFIINPNGKVKNLM